MPRAIQKLSKTTEQVQLKKFTGTLLAETNDAWLFAVDINGNDFEEWFPKSCCWYKASKPNRIDIPLWLAERKGFSRKDD